MVGAVGRGRWRRRVRGSERCQNRALAGVDGHDVARGVRNLTLGVGDQEHRLHGPEQGGLLGAGEPVVDPCRDRPDPGCCEVGREVFEAGRQAQGHDVAGPYAPGPQACGHVLDDLLELGVGQGAGRVVSHRVGGGVAEPRGSLLQHPWQPPPAGRRGSR